MVLRYSPSSLSPMEHLTLETVWKEKKNKTDLTNRHANRLKKKTTWKMIYQCLDYQTHRQTDTSMYTKPIRNWRALHTFPDSSVQFVPKSLHQLYAYSSAFKPCNAFWVKIHGDNTFINFLHYRCKIFVIISSAVILSCLSFSFVSQCHNHLKWICSDF